MVVSEPCCNHWSRLRFSLATKSTNYFAWTRKFVCIGQFVSTKTVPNLLAWTKKGPITCCSVCSGATAGRDLPSVLLPIASMLLATHFDFTNQPANQPTRQCCVLKTVYSGPQQVLAHPRCSLIWHMDSVCPQLHFVATPPWLRTTQSTDELLAAPFQKVQPFSVRIFRCTNVPSEKKRGSRQCQRHRLSIWASSAPPTSASTPCPSSPVLQASLHLQRCR